MGIFDNAKEVRINNKVVKSIIGENNMTLYINGDLSQPKSITLTNLGNSSVVYGTTVQLQATYSELGATLTGKTVTLYDGSTVKTTGTTDSNGEVTFSLPTLGVGSHQFKVTCNNTESDVITVVVNKVTPTLSLSGSNISYGGTLSLSGVLSAGSGKSVKIYNGNTLVDTVTTTTDGAFSKSVTGLAVGSYTFKAVFDGDGVYNNVNSADLAITVSKANSSLTINVPANLTYTDDFNISGVLLIGQSTPLANATVKLKVGDTVVDTQTSNSNGTFQFTQTPVSMGTHTFQLVYEGDANYNGCTSSSVTRQINAETTVLNLTSPVNNATYHEGATIPISGTITTNDGEQLSSENPLTVSVYDENNNQLRQFSVTNGAFSGNITAPSSVGNHSITVKFEGASTVPSVPDEEPQLMYAQSEATRSYTVTSDSLTVTSNKNILSQADNDVATITATYDANDNSGKAITFSGAMFDYTISSSVKDIGDNFSIIATTDTSGNWNYLYSQSDNYYLVRFCHLNSTTWVIQGSRIVGGTASTLFYENAVKEYGIKFEEGTVTFYKENVGFQTVELADFGTPRLSLRGTVSVKSDVYHTVTDSNGQASVSYTSQGADDVTITAECMSLQETYSLEDCSYYRTTSYTNSTTTLNIPLPSHFTLEYVLKQVQTNGAVPYLDIGDSTNNRMLVGQYARAGANGLIIYKSSSTTHAYGTNPTVNADNTIWFKYDGTKYYYKLNDGTVMEVADADVTLTKLIHVQGGDGTSNYLKNIKIKPL